MKRTDTADWREEEDAKSEGAGDSYIPVLVGVTSIEEEAPRGIQRMKHPDWRVPFSHLFEFLCLDGCDLLPLVRSKARPALDRGG